MDNSERKGLIDNKKNSNRDLLQVNQGLKDSSSPIYDPLNISNKKGLSHSGSIQLLSQDSYKSVFDGNKSKQNEKSPVIL